MKHKTKKSKIWCEAGYCIPIQVDVELGTIKTGKRGIQYRTYDHGEPPTKKVRCPKCRKRLIPRMRYCIGGEFVGYCIPPHKKLVKQHGV